MEKYFFDVSVTRDTERKSYGKQKHKIMPVTVMMIPIVAIISFLLLVVIIRKFTNDERMALIEKGGDANIFNRKTNAYPNLRYGLLLVGAGLGLFIGGLLANARLIEEEAAYFSMLFLFGGLGLFLSYFLEKKEEKKDK